MTAPFEATIVLMPSIIPTEPVQALRAAQPTIPVRSAALAHQVHARLRSDILFARLRPGHPGSTVQPRLLPQLPMKSTI